MTLTRTGCGRLYESANGKTAPSPWEGRKACRACPVGHFHLTGQRADPTTALAESLKMVCPRCGRKAHFFIKELCSPCRSRELEALKGANSKGSRPALSDELHTETVIMVVNGRSQTIVRATVTGYTESILHASKLALGTAMFGRRRLRWPALIAHGRRSKTWSRQWELGL